MSVTLSSYFLACLLNAASLQGLPPQLVLGVADVENGAVGLASKNSNGTEDLGIMQINTGVWLKPVADMHFKGDEKAAYKALRDDGCYNIQIGTWILKQAVADADGNYFEGVGIYHSRTPKYKKRYQKLFKKKFLQRYAQTEKENK